MCFVVIAVGRLSNVECNDGIMIKVKRLSKTKKKNPICSSIHCFKADGGKSVDVCHQKSSLFYVSLLSLRRRHLRRPKWMLVHLMFDIRTSTSAYFNQMLSNVYSFKCVEIETVRDRVRVEFKMA